MDKLRFEDYKRIYTAMKNLEDIPRPPGCIKLAGGVNEFRIIIGKFRVLYDVSDKSESVTIYRILPRDKAYKR
ncbi:type II toxin-antitoxin system RelE/ParE family toxin [bacterium]|nr:type II toxin-antitoxin system RelE/ParE family toxin [bacterium]